MAGLFLPNLTPEQIANARKWIAALRSGEYQQGQGQLCVVGRDGSKRWCCLGVACDVLGMEPPGARGGLSPKEREELGVRTGVGCFAPFCSLSTLNDTDKRTFPAIADVIEAELALVTEVTA